MAKDPAFLFYVGDYISGTMHLNFEEKGAYIELLMLQFNAGHMTKHMIGRILGQDADKIWSAIQDKFKVDEDGKYYNERLDEEKFKRKAYTQSRRNNVLGRNQYSKKKETKRSHDQHMKSHMENEDENVNDNKNTNTNKAKIEKEKITLPFDSEIFRMNWENWKQYKRKEFGFKYKSAQSEQATLMKLANMANDEKDAISIIIEAMANGWKGFYKNKNNVNGKERVKQTSSDYSNAYRKIAEELESHGY